MTRILWLSRHQLTSEQVNDLRRIYGEDVDVKHADATVSDWKEVTELGEDCDVLGVVLPPAILGDLVFPRNNTKPVIRARMKRVPTGGTIKNPTTGREEAEYAFEFDAWERVKRIVVEVEDL